MILFLSFLVVFLDLLFLCSQEPWLRMIPCLLFFVFTAFYYKTLPWEYGFQVKIQPSISYWTIAFVVIGSIMLSFCLICLGIFKIFHIPIPHYTLFRNDLEFRNWILFACFISPLVEETIYRSVLCSALEKTAGTKTSILISGILFALLHFFYGNLAFDNFIAGYLLAWSFLKSKSILIPIFLHALGNAFVGLLYCII